MVRTALVPLLGFLQPERLWLLALIPLLAGLYLGLVRRQQRRRRRVAPSMFDLVLRREVPWRRHAAVALSILSLGMLTAAFAQPTGVVEVPRERATIVVTIDVSLSMQARDVEPDRITAAKAGAVTFVESLPAAFNVALVSFAGTASVLVPPTQDHAVVTAAIEDLALEPSTAIGEGIYTSLQALQQLPVDPSNPEAVVPARIVLLSDGKTQVGRPADEAARVAGVQDVPIYTIAYGTQDGYIEVNGYREPVPVDEAELARAARLSGGEAYVADTSGELRNVYQDIGSSIGQEKIEQEVTARFAGYGLALAVLAALGVGSLAARWP